VSLYHVWYMYPVGILSMYTHHWCTWAPVVLCLSMAHAPGSWPFSETPQVHVFGTWPHIPNVVSYTFSRQLPLKLQAGLHLLIRHILFPELLFLKFHLPSFHVGQMYSGLGLQFLLLMLGFDFHLDFVSGQLKLFLS